jgi:uncharacterized protein
MPPTSPKMIFINLPVATLSTSIPFYTRLGFSQNQTFTDHDATMLALPPLTNGVGTINLMLLTHAKFQSFLPRDRVTADMRKSAQVLLCLSCESKDEVDEMVERAVQAGGKGPVCPLPEVEMAGMYGSSFEDLDGHVWEVVWMSEEMVKAGEGMPKEMEGKEGGGEEEEKKKEKKEEEEEEEEEQEG